MLSCGFKTTNKNKLNRMMHGTLLLKICSKCKIFGKAIIEEIGQFGE